MSSPFYVRVEVADRPGVLALVALRLAAHGVSVARLVQQQGEDSATLHIVTHEAAGRAAGRARWPRSTASTRRVASRRRCRSISDRGVAELGWA